jgi:hypothetical protein
VIWKQFVANGKGQKDEAIKTKRAMTATMMTDLDLDQSGERKLCGRVVYHLGSQRLRCSA